MTLAITKILNIKEGKQSPGRHLLWTLHYIVDPTKTGDGRYIGAVGCQPDYAYEQMVETKKLFAKADKRQGYHIIISFEEGEITANTAYEFIGRFVDEYLSGEYEAVYAVHDNTDHIHGHIVFNSVNKITGNKYRYKKGDWAKYIQPITNRLCEEYGLSTIDIDEMADKDAPGYTEWRDTPRDRSIWSDMIRRDLDALVIKCLDFDRFLSALEDLGYEIKRGKYLSIRPPGMARFRRTATLGARYTEDALIERIATEDLLTYQKQYSGARVVRVKIPYHLKRAKLSGIQKKYFRKLYETGKLRKRPYSKAWQYRDEIRKFKRLQAQYLFLAKHEIHDKSDLMKVMESLNEKKAELSQDKKALYKEQGRFRPLFDMADRLQHLEPAELSFQDGDTFFSEEHKEYVELSEKLKSEGYSHKEVCEFRTHYEVKMRELKNASIEISRELHLADELMDEYDTSRTISEKEKKQDKTLSTRQSK